MIAWNRVFLLFFCSLREFFHQLFNPVLIATHLAIFGIGWDIYFIILFLFITGSYNEEDRFLKY